MDIFATYNRFLKRNDFNSDMLTITLVCGQWTCSPDDRKNIRKFLLCDKRTNILTRTERA